MRLPLTILAILKFLRCKVHPKLSTQVNAARAVHYTKEIRLRAHDGERKWQVAKHKMLRRGYHGERIRFSSLSFCSSIAVRTTTLSSPLPLKFPLCRSFSRKTLPGWSLGWIESTTRENRSPLVVSYPNPNSRPLGLAGYASLAPSFQSGSWVTATAARHQSYVQT